MKLEAIKLKHASLLNGVLSTKPNRTTKKHQFARVNLVVFPTNATPINPRIFS